MRQRSFLCLSTALLMLSASLGACSYTFTRVEGKHISDASMDSILDSAWEAFRREDYERAAKLAVYIRETFPELPEVEEALYLAGESSYQLGDLYDAFQYFKELQTRFRASQYINNVASRYFDIGEAYFNRKPGFFGHLFTGRSRGVRVMTYLITHFSQYELVDDAQMAIGEYYFNDEDWIEAADAYTQLVKTYPRSEWVEKAIYRLAMSYLNLSEGPSYDRENLLRAHAALGSYINSYPKGNYIEEAKPYLIQVKELLAEKEYEIAMYYSRLDNDFGARIHLSNIVLLFPESRISNEARKIMDERGWDTSIHSVDRIVPRTPMDYLKF